MKNTLVSIFFLIILIGSAFAEPIHFLFKKNKKLFSEGEYPE